MPALRSRHDSQQQQHHSSSSGSGSWITASTPNIYYRPVSRRRTPSSVSASSGAAFPAPLIGPRRNRPYAIHILTYPAGYVPRELRPPKPATKDDSRKSRFRKAAKDSKAHGRKRNQGRSNSIQRHGTDEVVSRTLDNQVSQGSHQENRNAQQHQQPDPRQTRHKHQQSLSIRPVLGKLFASFSSSGNGSSVNVADSAQQDRFCEQFQHASSDQALAAHANANSDRSSAGIWPALPSYDVIHHQRHPAQQDTALHIHQREAQSQPDLHQRQIHQSLTVTGQAGPASSSHSRQLSQHYRPPPLQRHSLCCTTPHLTETLHHHHQHSHHIRHHSLQGTPIHTTFNHESSQDSLQQQQQQQLSLQRRTIHDIPQGFVPPDNSAMAGRIAVPPSAYHVPGTAYGRNSLMAVRSAKSAVSSLVTEVPKPVASGSGVNCSILLAEPNIFLSGFDHHDGRGSHDGQSGTALLRGKLQLNVSKNVKIKAVQLKLLGRARTEWPEGIPPLKQDLYEEESLRTQVLTFFNAMNDGWETDYGNQCTYQLKGSSANSSTTNLEVRPSLASPIPSSSSRNNLTAKDLKRLSLQNVQSRSFNKSDSPIATTTQAKGFKVFYPGTYDYSFELPIDHHQLETIKLQYGSVKWELHATVDRAGAFKPNLHGMKEVSIVRLPDQLSLEMSEPISISRQWEDQLHYDIIISGKSFPIGSKIPVAFKLTPLAKVQVHKLKVFVTESIEYWTNDKRVTRKDPGRKILLLEKAAGKPLDPVWASSEMRTLRGGELSPEARREAREIAARRRSIEASRQRTEAAPLPEPTENLLGDLDLGLESYWGSTEIEANVQIPTCEMMAKNKELRLHPDCSWKNVNVYHWIKIVMRISRLDPDDPTGKKRRHFEISIDSPFTVLDCQATQANTNLPAYSNPTGHQAMYQTACGCPDSATISTGPAISPSSSTGSLPGADLTTDPLPAPPQAAHVHATSMNPASATQTPPLPPDAHGTGVRPIHLLRAPSFNPPAFDEDSAPPPVPELVDGEQEVELAPAMTPPPQYDVVIGTPSVDGMADYFARLADYGYEGAESGSDSDETPPRILERSGRVNVAHPRTPGGRMPSRSLEISRPPIDLNLDSLASRRAHHASEAAV